MVFSFLIRLFFLNIVFTNISLMTWLSEKLLNPDAQLDAPQFPYSGVAIDESNRCGTHKHIKIVTFC